MYCEKRRNEMWRPVTIENKAKLTERKQLKTAISKMKKMAREKRNMQPMKKLIEAKQSNEIEVMSKKTENIDSQ